MTMIDSYTEWRHSIEATQRRIDFVVLQQEAYNVNVPILRGEVQRCNTVAPNGIDMYAGTLQEQFDHVRTTIVRGDM